MADSRRLAGPRPTGDAEIVIEVRNLSKNYGGLRPLRIAHLELRQGQALALVGFDRVTAEVLVNLLTGASVPDSGEVRLFGALTTAIPDGDSWLASLDRFGMLTERAVLLEGLSVQQNLAVPFSLDLDPIPAAVQTQVEQLGADVGLSPDDLVRPVSAIPPAARLRVRLARAIALNPRVLLAEHPNALSPAEDLSDFAADFTRIVSRRGLASLTLTADRRFASAVATRVLDLRAATGELTAEPAWRRWLARDR